MVSRLPQKGVLCVVLALVIAVGPRFRVLGAAAQTSNPGEGVTHRDDPCDQLPDPPGKANGIDKKCPRGGSSSGVAKGDFNGDGFADLAIGEPGATFSGHYAAGDVVVIYGSANGLTTNTPGIPGRQLFYEGRVPGSPEAGDLFGSALASGDFNNDGYSDLAIGAPGESTTHGGTHGGAVIVVYGSPSGLDETGVSGPNPRFFDLGQAAPPANNGVSFNFAEAALGSSLAWGDFNGDGVGDLAAGAPKLSVTGCSLAFITVCIGASEVGAVWQLLGSAGSSGGLKLTGNHVFLEGDPYATTLPLYSHYDHAHFGASLAGGNFDGDAYTDLAVGSPDESFTEGSFFNQINHPEVGSVTILLGGLVGLSVSTGGFGSGGDYDHSGAALAAGDFDGDGKADLAIGVPGRSFGSGALLNQNVGEVLVFYGSSTGLNGFGSKPFQTWDQDALFPNSVPKQDRAGDQFGYALAAGDFNGDGKADLAIGAPFDDITTNGVTFTNAGEVDVIYGSSTGLGITTRPAQRWHQDSPGVPDNAQTGDHFGQSLTAWNFGRNECPGGASFCLLIQVQRTADLAIGVPFEDVNGISNAGAVHVLYGNANGLTTTNTQFFTADSLGLGGLAGAHFGASMY